MKIEKQLSDNAILSELGTRLMRRRLDLELSQIALAEQAGLGKRTLERLESGKDVQLTTLIRLLRQLDLLETMDRLLPETGIRPMELLKRKGKERRRAPTRHPAETPRKWQWGDEQ